MPTLTRLNKCRKGRVPQNQIYCHMIACLYVGAPLNVMKRGVLCGSTEQLLKQLLPHIKHIDYPPDEAD